MATHWSPLRALHARLAGFVWTTRGRRALGRGDLPSALKALEMAVSWRPCAFKPLFLLGRGYLRAEDTWRAHRVLARAREADPLRFAREAERCLADESLDRETLGRVLGVGHGAPTTAAPTRGRVHVIRAETRADGSLNLPYGDCADLDEYARFQAMPPISRAEIETVDWERVIEDLLEE